MQHLNNEEQYRKLQSELTELFSSQIKPFLLNMKSNHSIHKDTLLSLLLQNIRTSHFYILTKIHKPRIPGKLIVSSCGALAENILHFVDHHACLLVRKIPPYIKDKTDFLLKLEDINNLLSSTLWVTIDVTFLYTNIPHSKGVAAFRPELSTREVLWPPMESLIELIEMILMINNFTFEGAHYLQSHGMAMVTQIAFSFANIFLGHLE